MLGKLIKHEFHATARRMLPLFGIVLFSSLLAHFAIRGLDREIPSVLRNLLIIILVLFSVGLVAVSAVAFIQMVLRFRTNVLGDEGYLTMTLPVSVHGVIWSKIIVSVVWFAATVIVVVLSLLIMTFRVEFVREAAAALWDLLQHVEGMQVANYAAMLAELLVNAILYGIAICLTFYSALSIGHGFARHKMLFSVAAYFILGFILSYVFSLILSPLFVWLFRTFSGGEEVQTGAWHLIMGISAGTAILQGAVHYVITVWNLRRRLNLA